MVRREVLVLFAAPVDEGEPSEAAEEEASEWSEMSSSGNSVIEAVVSLAAHSYGSVTGAIRIVSTQLAQIDKVDMLRGFGQTCVAAFAASSVSQYQ